MTRDHACRELARLAMKTFPQLDAGQKMAALEAIASACVGPESIEAIKAMKVMQAHEVQQLRLFHLLNGGEQ